ncbi:hypothetical protein [Rhodococcus pyridinivorans]|uniref:hypothetical protein n=1 Tax=Rhodococcus pyridinivorans TaxID=103816 RepID=UPI00110D8164|nr:hypothetical protein [Rhodococcus pyridinivorans]
MAGFAGVEPCSAHIGGVRGERGRGSVRSGALAEVVNSLYEILCDGYLIWHDPGEADRVIRELDDQQPLPGRDLLRKDAGVAEQARADNDAFGVHPACDGVHALEGGVGTRQGPGPSAHVHQRPADDSHSLQ